MSNSLAIATVTAALQDLLQPAVSQAVGQAKVGFSRPDSSNQQAPLVNVYLYQVTPNAAFRNNDVPTRRPDGSLSQRPQTALDLHYLFTFHGNDDQFEPQRLLGAVVTTLTSQPVLSRQNIVNAMNNFSFLKKSNLADQVERVRFTPTSLSLEEFSKLWSVFFQIEYSLSAAFQASVVLLESDDTPLDALPVLARNIYVGTLRPPTVDRVISQAGPDVPIEAGTTLLIQGQQLRGDTTLVLLEGQERTPATVADTQVTIALPTDVHAGVQGLQIVQKKKIGTPETLHRGVESNVAPFVLRPVISAPPTAAAAATGGTDVTLQLTPNIGIGQRAVLMLNSLPAAAPAAFVSLPFVATADTAQITINIKGVPSGKYLVRVQIDGAESRLTTTAGVFSDPAVQMP